MCFWLVLIIFRPLPTFQSSASLRNVLMTHTFLMNFLIPLKLQQISQALMPSRMLHGLLHHSAVFIYSACHSLTIARRFYVRNPRDSLLADEGLTSLRPVGSMGGWVTGKQWMLAKNPVGLTKLGQGVYHCNVKIYTHRIFYLWITN